MEDDCDPVSVKCSTGDFIDDLKTLFIDKKKLNVDPAKFFLFFGQDKLNSTDKVELRLHDGATVSPKPRAA